MTLKCETEYKCEDCGRVEVVTTYGKKPIYDRFSCNECSPYSDMVRTETNYKVYQEGEDDVKSYL